MNNKNEKKILHFGLIVNFINVLTILILIFYVSSDNSYVRFGPSKDLYVLGINIDTWTKYMVLQIILCFNEVISSYSIDKLYPIMYFNINNPDKKEIINYNINELQFYGNSLYFLYNIRYGLQIVISISQIDITLLKVLYSEFTCAYSIRTLLNEKTFKKKTTYETVNVEINPIHENIDKI